MVWVKGQSGNPAGGPLGNQHAKKHGVRALQMARRIGQIDKRTAFGQAFEKRKREYIAHLGGEVSAMELAIIEDTVWTDFYTTNYDVYLAGLNSTIRKGRPHPLVDARTRLAAHRRENLKSLGLQRRVKSISLTEILAKDESINPNGYERSPRNPESGRFEPNSTDAKPTNSNGTADNDGQ